MRPMERDFISGMMEVRMDERLEEERVAELNKLQSENEALKKRLEEAELRTTMLKTELGYKHSDTCCPSRACTCGVKAFIDSLDQEVESMLGRPLSTDKEGEGGEVG